MAAPQRGHVWSRFFLPAGHRLSRSRTNSTVTLINYPVLRIKAQQTAYALFYAGKRPFYLQLPTPSISESNPFLPRGATVVSDSAPRLKLPLRTFCLFPAYLYRASPKKVFSRLWEYRPHPSSNTMEKGDLIISDSLPHA